MHSEWIRNSNLYTAYPPPSQKRIFWMNDLYYILLFKWIKKYILLLRSSKQGKIKRKRTLLVHNNNILVKSWNTLLYYFAMFIIENKFIYLLNRVIIYQNN